MAEEPELRRNRMALLAGIVSLSNKGIELPGL